MKRFTIYDAMEARGVFSSNPNNVGATDPITGENRYVKAAYPKMFYHPKGETMVVLAGAVDPITGRVEGLQREIITRLAKSEAEAGALREAGWWDHPGDAVAAGGGVAPPRTAGQKISSLEQELADLKRRHEELLGAAASTPVAPAASAIPDLGEAELRAKGLM